LHGFLEANHYIELEPFGLGYARSV
jgi:hypothetical protein